VTAVAKPAPLPAWEHVGFLLDRLPIPGGWIYRTTDDSTQHVAIAFVPRPSPEISIVTTPEDPL